MVSRKAERKSKVKILACKMVNEIIWRVGGVKATFSTKKVEYQGFF